jgi:hypothetical protein
VTAAYRATLVTLGAVAAIAFVFGLVVAVGVVLHRVGPYAFAVSVAVGFIWWPAFLHFRAAERRDEGQASKEGA